MIKLQSKIAQEYALKIQQLVIELKRGVKRGVLPSNCTVLDEKVARKKYSCKTFGKFFLFPHEAPSDEIINDYYSGLPDYGLISYKPSFRRHLSHKGVTVIFDHSDLVLRLDDEWMYRHTERLTENNLINRIELSKELSIDLELAKIYIFPYKTLYFFIDESFNISHENCGRLDLINPNNWFSIPFSDNIDYRQLRRICSDFVDKHQIEYEYDHFCQCEPQLLDKIEEEEQSLTDEEINEFLDRFFLADNFKEIKYGTTYGERIELLSKSSPSRTIKNYQIRTPRNLPNSFVGIDFETLYPQRVSACSVGMVKYIDGKIVDRYYTLIRPPFDYPGKCGSALTWIHGLTEEMVNDARTFAEILPEMESFVDGLPLVAHNACVERACIHDASAFYGIETKLDYENIFDTLYISRQAEAKLGISVEGPGTHQLDTVCKRFGISGNNHHNALADAEMTGNLMVKFHKILEEGKTVEITKVSHTPQKKYNPEDKVQRTDLDSVADNPFKNQVVVLTGFAKADSQEYAHKLNELGAIIKEGVNKKTNILITGYNAGPSKMQKAQELGVRIMSEDEFKDIINQITNN